jgi:ATP-dependent helicase/nuclease subunit A
VGTLHHRFLQRMVLTGACDAADLETQRGGLVERGVFSAAEAAALDLAALVNFWRGEVGSEVRANVSLVKRELPFTARFTPKELERLTGAKVLPAVADEFVVVQGVADLVVVRERELWLLDFKTDQLRAGELAGKVSAYRPQLQIYAAALSAIYNQPVTRSWLHFLAVGETVEV